jgi:hypothetical protein
MPVSALLTRIRRIIPGRSDEHYDEIVRAIGNGSLRAPASPMTDQELSRAIAEFLEGKPSTEAVASFGRRLDPSSPV